MEFVKIDSDGVPRVTSWAIAKAYQRSHKDIVAGVEAHMARGTLSRDSVKTTSYVNADGKEVHGYSLDRYGFLDSTCLVTGDMNSPGHVDIIFEFTSTSRKPGRAETGLDRRRRAMANYCANGDIDIKSRVKAAANFLAAQKRDLIDRVSLGQTEAEHERSRELGELRTASTEGELRLHAAVTRADEALANMSLSYDERVTMLEDMFTLEDSLETKLRDVP